MRSSSISRPGWATIALPPAPTQSICRRNRLTLRNEAQSSNSGGTGGAEVGVMRSSVVIRSTPVTRRPAEAPQPVPVEHSSTYLLRTSKHKAAVDEEQHAASLLSPSSRLDQEPGNVVDWALRKADKSLEQVEENPPAYAKALYELTNGPVGTTAGKGVVAAAKLTAQAGSQALKAAAPVGKWIVSKGMQAAAGAVAQGVASVVAKNKKNGDQKNIK